MNRTERTMLDVLIQDLASVRVAYIDYQADSGEGDIHGGIRSCFERVQNWVKKLGHDPYSLLNVRIPRVDHGQLLGHGWCVQLPPEVESGTDGVGIKELPGGRYALVSIVKDSQTIGQSIGYFHQQYVREHNIKVDGMRPIYEIYWENTMEYCEPIQ